LQHDDWRRGALIGAITGAFMGVPDALGWQGLAHTAVSIATGTAAGGVSAAISGGSIAKGMLSGGLFSWAESAYYSKFQAAELWGDSAASRFVGVANQLTNSSLHGAAYGAAYAGATGGNVLSGAVDGAKGWAAGDLANMAFGHVAGLVGSGFRTPYYDGQFVYDAPLWSHLQKGAITFSNVSLFSEFTRRMPIENLPYAWQWYRKHEMSHGSYQEPILGPSYMPSHALSLTTGAIWGLFKGESLAYGSHAHGLLEINLMSVPWHP
jgi:hypothetical protein